MNTTRTVRLIFIAVFVAALWTPTVFGVAEYLAKPRPAAEPAVQAASAPPAHKDGEKAAPAPAAQEQPEKPAGPSLASLIKDYPRSYQSGYNANFPLREKLVKLSNASRIAVFGESPVKGVVLGKNNWLYYNLEWAMEDYENLAPFSPDDLDKIDRVLSERTAWLAAKGVPYFVMVAPNSQTIYPEFLPDRFHKLSPYSRLDQLKTRLAGRRDINLVDPRDALFKAKAERRAYHMSDTHWNDWGAFAAANLLLGGIGRGVPGVAPDRLEDSVMTILRTQGGDLAGLLSLEFPEDYPSIVPKAPRLAKLAGGTDPQGRLVRGGTLIFETGRPELPKAVVFHDSFFVALMPMLAEHFSRIVYVWNFSFDTELIEREKPDVVILECVERYIYALTLDNPPAVAGK
jgi:alginate O-acetyltransferase complex protein AlgJ